MIITYYSLSCSLQMVECLVKGWTWWSQRSFSNFNDSIRRKRAINGALSGSWAPPQLCTVLAAWLKSRSYASIFWAEYATWSSFHNVKGAKEYLLFQLERGKINWNKRKMHKPVSAKWSPHNQNWAGYDKQLSQCDYRELKMGQW